jgi:hypothetical protein
VSDWIATRAEGEKIMVASTPRMGRRYANGRNTDHGPGAHKAVSVLLDPDGNRVDLFAAIADEGVE